MWWIIILIPVCFWISWAIMSYMNILSLILLLLILLGFMVYEAWMLKKSDSRSKMPLYVMGLLELTIIISIIVNALK